MHRLSAVQEFLGKKKAFYVSSVRERPSDGALMLYVSRELIGAKVSNGITSWRQLRNIQKSIEHKFSCGTEVITFTDEAHQVLEAGLFKAINQKFNGAVVSLFLSFVEPLKTRVFIEVAALHDKMQREMRNFLVETLAKTEVEIEEIEWFDSPLSLPNSIALLRTLKTSQPVTLNGFASIVQKSFPAASKDWLSHRLDYLRKKELVLRQKDATYVLTTSALRLTPAGTRRASSDIDRALALGRRRW